MAKTVFHQKMYGGAPHGVFWQIFYVGWGSQNKC